MKSIINIILIAALTISSSVAASSSITGSSSGADSSSVAGEIEIALLLTPKQRSPFAEVFRQFTKETGIKVTTVARTDAEYKEYLPVWLLEGKKTPDVLYWQASQRLFFYVEKEVIQPITHLWNENHFNDNFSHVRDVVTYKGDIYAIPFSYYHWGIFYRKTLVEKYGGLPQTWEAFIAQCEEMKKDGITPIGIGTKNSWPAAAWFDYINLRINGLKFHQQVLTGKISFHDRRLQNVLVEWKKLIDKGFFNKDNRELAWDGVLPKFYRDRVGFILIGNFATSKFPKRIVNEIGFMPFPRIKDIPLYEEAPMDVFMIARNTKNLKEAELFIKFMARADVQSRHNKQLGYLPPNKSATVGQDPFIQAGANLLKQAYGISQYFDRDTLPGFDKKAVPLLAEFLNTGDLQEVTEKLEQARKEVFLK